MGESSRIEAVIFDLGRVIVDVDVMRLSRNVLEKLPGGDIEKIVAEVMGDELMVRFNKGTISAKGFHEAMCEKFSLEMGFDEFRGIWCSIFSPMEGMSELIGRLAGRVKLGLLSDTDELHWGYLLEEIAVLEVFEKPTLSFEVGMMKPEAGIYVAAAENVGAEPGGCLYIDDLSANVEGAVKVGMCGVQFESASRLESVLESYGLL